MSHRAHGVSWELRKAFMGSRVGEPLLRRLGLAVGLGFGTKEAADAVI